MSARSNDAVWRSVHDRLLKLAVSRKEDFNALLARYGNERILYRLSQTMHGRRFVLKGASLFIVWLGKVHRPTRDLDLLGSGQVDPASLKAVIQDVCDYQGGRRSAHHAGRRGRGRLTRRGQGAKLAEMQTVRIDITRPW